MEIKALIKIHQFATTFSPVDIYRFSSQLNNFIDIVLTIMDFIDYTSQANAPVNVKPQGRGGWHPQGI